MVGYFDIEDFFDGLFDTLDPRVAELDHLSAGKDDMVVLFVEIGLFVMRLVLPELMFSYQAAFQ